MAERRHTDASTLERDLTLAADVAIVGTGAGGGTAAEILSRAGLRVVMIEEGPYQSARDFSGLEADAYPALYWDSANRKSRDQAVTILQGRAVGGGTVVNWTTCFRAPPETLAHWADAHGIAGLDAEELAPWFAMMERRLGVAPWALPPNENNAVLGRGCAQLGWRHGIIARNVRECWDLGLCGQGCPTNAKQSMLVTTIPAALDHGAVLLSRTRAWRVVLDGARAQGLLCRAIDARSGQPNGRLLHIEARHVVLAAGAINGPALLLRSGVPDPHERLGKRTFLHLTNVVAGELPGPVRPFEGAPQSVYSDHFLWRDGVGGKLGYKLETPPVFPVLAATAFPSFGHAHADRMARLAHTHVVIALMRDGFNPAFEGGSIDLRDDGSAVLDYPLNDYLWEGLRHAYGTMLELSFAGGAAMALPLHRDAKPYRSWVEAKRAVANELPMKALRAVLYSAHVMGGCAMGGAARGAVVDGFGTHYQVENLSVMDGTLFPTSLGANPQMTIAALAARNATRLARALGGAPVAIA